MVQWVAFSIGGGALLESKARPGCFIILCELFYNGEAQHGTAATLTQLNLLSVFLNIYVNLSYVITESKRVIKNIHPIYSHICLKHF